LPIQIRLASQAAAVALGIFLLKNNIANDILPFVPLWLKIMAIFIGWLWYINLYNFMDGIDGITAMQTSSICVYILIILSCCVIPKNIIQNAVFVDSEVIIDISDDTITQNLSTGGEVAGKRWGENNLINYAPFIKALLVAMVVFFYFNKTPAKIFIGDSGSIALGFIMGALLIKYGCEYSILSAFCITIYYIADSTITVLWRLKDGEKIWTPHLRHFFAKAKIAGFSSMKICIILAILNILLGCTGYLILFYQNSRFVVISLFVLAIGLTLLILAFFQKIKKVDILLK
jgi:UDP-N-acetylmuramyl pentapeptide phosphotransferase/UDP-N-acetylglucosamine-1-phosphate transferase